MPTSTPPSRARLSFHEGETLLRLAATYPTLHRTVLEMIQNGIDANAKRIYVRIDLDKREAIVMDDGEGVTHEKFIEALNSVGRSVKPRQGTLGRFGLGLISPLDKVKSFVVMSIPRGVRGGGYTWTFDPVKIKATSEDVSIPVRELDKLPQIPNPWTETVGWRTVMKMIGITRDKVTTLISLDDLEDDVMSNFGQPMRIKGTICKVELIEDGHVQRREIKPRDYAGIPFETITLHGDCVGDVTFKLFKARSRNGKRQGVVSVHEADDAFLLPWKHFMRQLRAHGWKELSPAFEALGSGYFEGVISAKNATLDPGRTKFVANDALFDLYSLIHEWYEKHGKSYLNDEKEKSHAERLQVLGLRSLERWNDLLDDEAYRLLRDALKGTFVYGRLGAGHVDPATGRDGGEQGESSIRVGQGGAGKQRTPRSEGENHPRPAEGERNPDRPGDIPLGAIGPRGNKRKLVKHDSIGLQIAHEPLDSTRLWELDANYGILYFNTTHRLWERCESKDAWVLHLQEWVIMQVLHLLVLPAELFETTRQVVDMQAKCYVEQFICSAPPKRR
jgi:hypothetical protein